MTKKMNLLTRCFIKKGESTVHRHETVYQLLWGKSKSLLRDSQTGCKEKKSTPCSRLLSRFSQLGILISSHSGISLLLRASGLSVCLCLCQYFLCFQIGLKAISWCRLRENMCVFCMCMTERQHVGLRVHVCVSVMALPCAESLYGTEWSRIWRNLSGLGYCQKPSFYYLLLLLFLLVLFILLFMSADCTGDPG